MSNMKGITENNKSSIVNFIVYGTKNSLKLGEGERAGVVSSFKSAFGKMPTTESDWIDVLAIANGRWPNQVSKSAEDKAKVEFKKIYKRANKITNNNDNAAITIMAYGLRNVIRNTKSENVSIKAFKSIYKKGPISASDWDIVRAIAYSGAKR
jgi:hypothetical protein